MSACPCIPHGVGDRPGRSPLLPDGPRTAAARVKTMALDGRRPRRRGRRWVLLAFVLTLVVLAVNAAGSSRAHAPVQAQETLGYLDTVRPLIERSTQQGADLVDARINAGSLGRDGVMRRL